MAVGKNPFEDMDDEEYEYLQDKSQCSREKTQYTYDEIGEKWKEQDAKWKKGQFVILSDSAINQEFGYDGLVGQIVENDKHASHLGYVTVKIVNKGKWKDKVISVEVHDIKKTAEKDIVRHLVMDAL